MCVIYGPHFNLFRNDVSWFLLLIPRTTASNECSSHPDNNLFVGLTLPALLACTKCVDCKTVVLPHGIKFTRLLRVC
ncbi:hypothetical protein AHF37_03122 [Paragonimus kellicotti]|nr:hypothetical protein AHF37_03122 [Paragonimus kellicotti]